jgi:hypothetical protein
MVRRIASLLCLAATVTLACDCIPVPAREAKRYAEVVFRGTIVGFHDSANGERMVVFQVNRVWKGKLTERFEMLAWEGDSCHAFRPGQLMIGNELLVYASRVLPHPEYLAAPCNTDLVKRTGDIQMLGLGKKPTAK